jgi:hypothetical protein
LLRAFYLAEDVIVLMSADGVLIEGLECHGDRAAPSA